MKVLMVLGIVLAALVLLSLVRLGALVEYGTSGLILRVKLGPFRLTVLPRKAEKDKSEKQKKNKKEKKKANQEQGEGKPQKGGPLALVKQFLPLIGEAAGRVKRKIRIDAFYLNFTAAAPDPAMTALAFGGANAAIGMIWPIIEQNFNVKDWRIRTYVDFDAKAPVIWLQAAVTLTIGQAVSLGIYLAAAFLRLSAENKKKAKSQQKRKQPNQSKKEAV